MAGKTGIVALVGFVKHICHLLVTWRGKIDGALDFAVTTGSITSSQAATVKTWLDGAEAACTVLRIVTGY